MEAGNYAEAAGKFQAFQQAYPGGPLTEKAGLKLRGEALAKSGDLKQAWPGAILTFSAPMRPGLSPRRHFCVSVTSSGSWARQTRHV